MKSFGVIILSFEEVAGLGDLLPWKSVPACDLYDRQGLCAQVPWAGVVVLSTCNRVEFIYSLPAGVRADEAAHEALQRAVVSALPALPAGVQPRCLFGRQAVTHLVRLACGLESMVLGESEIKAQLNSAKQEARQHGRLDSTLHTLLQQVFRESRGIRNVIPMHNLPLSLPALAARRLRAQAPLGALAARGATPNAEAKDAPATVIIGSGPMSRQAAELLVKWSARLVWVNRTPEKVRGAAERFGANVLAFDDFLSDPGALGPVSGIVTATSHPGAFLDGSLVGRLNRASEGLTIVDLALPPDADGAVQTMPGVSLVTLDSLRLELEANRERRREVALAAEEHVQGALVRIEARLIATGSGRIIRQVQRRIRDRSRRSLEDLLGNRLAHLNARDRRALYDWAIRSNRDLNRIHREGVEHVLSEYYSGAARTG